MRIIGGPDNVRITHIGTDYRVADTATGGGASGWQEGSFDTTKGKFIQLRVTNSGSSATATSGTVNLNGYIYSFSSTTAPATRYPRVQFTSEAGPPVTGDRWQRVIGGIGPEDSYTGGFYLPRFKMTQPSEITTIFGTTASTGSTGQLTITVINTTGRMRVSLRRSGSGTGFGQTARFDTLVSVADGLEHNILVSWDTSQETAAAGLSVWVDNQSQFSPDAVLDWNGYELNWASPPTSGQFTFGGWSAVAPKYATFQTGGFWLHTEDRPNIDDPSVRAKFYPGVNNIGTNGEGPTGTAPAYWLNGNAAVWNNTAGINSGANGDKFGGGLMTIPASTGGVGTVINVPEN
jgi:hypothetical protein